MEIFLWGMEKSQWEVGTGTIGNGVWHNVYGIWCNWEVYTIKERDMCVYCQLVIAKWLSIQTVIF